MCIRCTQGNFQKKKNYNVISACKLVYSSMGSACTAGFISAAFLRNPPPEEISHILLLADRSGQQESTEDHIAANRGSQGAEVPTCTTCTPSVATFGAGLPPVPAKLIKRIQEGEFIEMGELAIDWLGLPSVEDSTKTSRSKRRPVTSIVEWAQCFSNYIAVLVQAQPERVADLLGYQHLILEAHLEYEGDGWVAYDRRFRQIAATAPGGLWAHRDVDLWNMVFFRVSAPTLLPVLLWLYPPVRKLQWSRRYRSNTLQGKRSKFTKNSDNKDMPRLEFLSTASLLISRMQVHSHLFGLLKRSIPWRQEPQTYLLSQKFLSATRTYGTSFNGVATAIATLPRIKKPQAQEPRIYLCDHDHCTYNYCCTCRYINSSIR